MRFQRPRPLRSRPSASVVIPCYNYGRYLPGAVASALDQDGVDVDVLIVDDASTDGSADIALALAAQDSRVDVMLHDQNRGHIATYNDGLLKVSGDYVALLSADDLLAPGALTRATALMEHHPRVGMTYGYARSFTEEPPPSDGARVRNWSVWNGREWLSLAARRGRCFLSSPEAVMRRDALIQAGGYDERLPHSADFDMWLRTAARWDVGRINGPAQAFYRVHNANMHLTTYAGWLTDLEERRRTFEILFEERAHDLPEVTSQREVAMRALAREALRRALRAQRDGPGNEDVSAYRDFAAATCPDISAGWTWRWCEHRDRLAPSSLGIDARRWVSRAWDHALWRRERRYGT